MYFSLVIAIACFFTPFVVVTAAFSPLPTNAVTSLSSLSSSSSYVTTKPSLCVTTTTTKRTSTCLFGIPKMFRWLTDQYPNINKRLNEGLRRNNEDGNDKMNADHLYLDMNGIIHPCTHGNAEDEIVLLDETIMFQKIFRYVDR